MYKNGMKFNREKFHSQSDDEQANLMREKRLDAVAAQKMRQDNEIKSAEENLDRTHQSLGILGAGKPYGG